MANTLYLDPFSGISGNMFMGALLELAPETLGPLEALVERIGIEGVALVYKRVNKCGIDAFHVDVEHPEQQAHRHLSDCVAIIRSLSLSETVTQNAIAIFENLADAEAKVHGTSREAVHFHEVGAVDAIVDIVAAAYLIDALNIDKIICAPLRAGKGFVKCAHGTMPVPAPATALLLQDIPWYAGDTEGEFTTPTGAAILKTCVDVFSALPTLKASRIGLGAGTKEFSHPNVLRVFLEQSKDESESETLCELSFHIDDMSAEGLAHFCEVVLEEGALDVSTWSGAGKKSRLTTMVRVLAHLHDEDKIKACVFNKTSTLGLRIAHIKRYLRERDDVVHNGVRAKRLEDGSLRLEPDDVAKVAREQNRSYDDVYRTLLNEV